jgi:cytochrome c oxidase assembly factor CtaG/ferredoxin
MVRQVCNLPGEWAGYKLFPTTCEPAMSTIFDAFLRSWPFEPGMLCSLLLTVVVYLRGWLVLHRRNAQRWPRGQPVAFVGGLAVLFLALASPIEPFTALLLQVHMLQHLLLMMVAPPLLWLGAPLLPLLRGLPQPIRTYWLAPLIRWRPLRRILQMLTHPVPAWLLFTAATWLWHLPPTYQLALGSDGWHYVQHVCFLGTALLFWYPVIRPYPSRPRWSLWLLIPYLILADVQNTILSAVLTFADRPLYSYYVVRPHLGNLSPLEDQATAGVLMWVPGSVAYLVPLFLIGLRLLFGGPKASRRRLGIHPQQSEIHHRPSGRLALPLVGQLGPRPAPSTFDVLRIPLIGRFLRWRHARLSLQVPLILLAGVIVYDGLCGPSIGAMNLAGVLPWIHWRGLVVLGMLTAGNVFCMACPFMLPRTLARRWLPAAFSWPPWLRNKWPAIVLLASFLWAYEALALWDSPWWTAWLVLAYFAAAFAVDGLFRGASFCKYVCPIGQFNFVQSLVAPWEIKVRDPAVCASCRTKDCIRGGDGIPGCELRLYQPRKSSNMDCTFCLDCIHACPHDNIGILSSSPGAELWRDPHRSGIGRFSRRPDLAVLALVLVFGAFINAAGMTGPLVDWQDRITAAARLPHPVVAATALYLIALVALPVLLIGSAAVVSRRWAQLTRPWTELATRFSYALIPLGFGMWLAHYSFHLLTSYATLVPTTQRFGADLGWTFLGSPNWNCACCVPVAGWLLRLEIMFLDLGLLLSLYAGYRVALWESPRLPQTLRALAPWAVLMVFLFAVGIWIVFQPMQMRGTMPMAR